MVVSKKQLLLVLLIWIALVIMIVVKQYLTEVQGTFSDQFAETDKKSTSIRGQNLRFAQTLNKRYDLNDKRFGRGKEFGRTSIQYEQLDAVDKQNASIDGQITTFNTEVVVYNRVSKCGSTTLYRMIEQASIENNFTFVNDHQKESTINFNDEQIADYIESLPKPVFYVRHMSYINFTAYGKEHPVYIQMLRDPLERVISQYYYNDFHFGKHKGISLEKCFLSKNASCTLLKPGNMLTKFCDTHTKLENRCSVERSKYTIEKDYIFVGITEFYLESIQAFTKLLPLFFPKNTTIVRRNSAKEAKGSTNPRPSTEILNYLAKEYKKDFEVYNFAKQLFYKKLVQLEIPFQK